ncbi:guanylin-like [Pelodytes ibericus]
MLLKALSILLLSHVCRGVIVKDGDFTFPLDSVKQLGTLLGRLQNVQSDASPVTKLCAIPELPIEFRDLCKSPDAAAVFTRLGKISLEPDVCDVCAFAACTGC